MKKLAAHDFEDLLQVFYSLFNFIMRLFMLSLVQHPSFRRTFARTTQYHVIETPFSNG
jgi:hypothetical protein